MEKHTVNNRTQCFQTVWLHKKEKWAHKKWCSTNHNRLYYQDWRHNWKSTQVVNSHLACDPTIWSFDLPRQHWSLLNHFCTKQGHCGALQKEMATYRHWSVSLWWNPDDVSHCRILSDDKTKWRLISAALCGWRRCFLADQLWFVTHIQKKWLPRLFGASCRT